MKKTAILKIDTYLFFIYFKIFLLLIICGIILSSCTKYNDEDYGVQITIYNVDNSLSSDKYVCNNSTHYYYYTNGKIYDDKGNIIHDVPYGVDVNDSYIGVNDSYMYLFEKKSSDLFRIDLVTLEEETIEEDISILDIYAYNNGTFIEFMKDDARYLKYYSDDKTVSIYDDMIKDNGENVVVIRNLDGLEICKCYFFEEYIIVTNVAQGSPYLNNIINNEQKEYASSKVFHNQDNDLYYFGLLNVYDVNFEQYRYNDDINYSGYPVPLEPSTALLNQGKIYMLYLFSKNQHFSNSVLLDSEVLISFDLDTKKREIIYKTTSENNEYIVNFSVDDNRIYTMKDGIVYMEPLDDVNSDGQEICDLTGYMELGFDYADGHLFIYNDANAELIGIY